MMSEHDFFSEITGSTNDLTYAVQALRASGQPFCLIGGLAVNQYADPMVTLDADFAIAASEGAPEALKAAGFIVEAFPHSLNAALPGSRLRIQITLDARYRDFPARAVAGVVFGVAMPVACLADVVQGKVWAASDTTRRASKRSKDRTDLIRLAETNPEVCAMVPVGMIPEVDDLRGQNS